MGEAIWATLKVMGWLGIIFGILVIVNTLAGIIVNVWSGKEKFSIKKMFKGIAKSEIFYISAIFVSVAFTMLPIINEMITSAFGVILVSSETLNTLSSVCVFGVVVSSIVIQGKKAIDNVVDMANMCTDVKTITYNIINKGDK